MDINGDTDFRGGHENINPPCPGLVGDLAPF
jgi:hypothetical protein